MNKKLLLSLILVAPLSYASDEPFSETLSGVHIVPLAKQNLPDEIKYSLKSISRQQIENGYVENNDDSANYLLNIKKNVYYQFADARVKDYGDADTRMKNSYKQIKLAFDYKPVAKKSDVIGYAAIGSFDKNKGWDGVKEVFKFDKETTCSYARMGIKAAQLSEETTEYFVNKKPSNKIIEGNVNSGFLYNINWYDNNVMHTLECANVSYKPEIMDNMIKIANKIDKR